VAACAKHFAVNSQEERRMIIDSVVDERTLREIYLTAFEIAVKEGKAKSVMSAYNPVNGIYANENEHLLQNILREEWGFEGVVITDWGGNNDRVAALKAGNELEMPTNGGETDLEIIEAVTSKRLSQEVLDIAVERLLRLVFETDQALKNNNDINIDLDKHHSLARHAAEQSIMLLKNDGGVLPLAPKTAIAVIGDFAQTTRYQGAGSSVVNPTKSENALNVLSGCDYNNIGFERGFKRFGKKSKSLIKKAVRLADKADVVLLYIGLNEAVESEGLDKLHLKLPQNQLDLIAALKATGKRIIAVLSCGSVVETGWTDDVDAVVYAGLGGQAVPSAVINIISGAVNPSGKLSESYPIKYDDVPSAGNFPGRGQIAEYKEALYVGYRYYDTAGVPVKFPFGFGLSYTEFEYFDLKVTDKGVAFTVKNVGEVDGAETAQMYISSKGQVFGPKKELKGFAKIQLIAGEAKEITIPFDEYTFRYYNSRKQCWETEACEYVIGVGASIADIRLMGNFTITQGSTVNPYNPSQLPSYYSGNIKEVNQAEFESLYGQKLPPNQYPFIKKHKKDKRCRLVVGRNTSISELKYSKGWFGRFFARMVRFAHWLLRAIGKRDAAAVLMMGVFHMPMRGLSRMSGGMFTMGQVDGLIMMCNGKFFKGLKKFFKERRLKKNKIKKETPPNKKQAAIQSKREREGEL
jgi:beta-glucosidase